MTAGRTAGAGGSMPRSVGIRALGRATATAPSLSGRSSSRAMRSRSARWSRCSPPCASARRCRATGPRSAPSKRASSPRVHSNRCSSKPLPPVRASKGAEAMNRDAVSTLTVAPLMSTARTLASGAALALLAVLTACSGGGAPVAVNAPPPTSAAQTYTGPPPQNADVQAFMINFWTNVTPANRCGGCHHAGGQSPMFARSDDVNLAYQAALPLVNLSDPSQSTFVLKVGGGHNCWVADPSACAATMLVWIQNWIGAGSSSTTSVKLVAPPVQAPGGGKQFPSDPTQGNPSYQQSVYPLLKQYCSGCHNPSSGTAQQPYFADPNNLMAAYLAAQPKINLAT